MGGGNAHVLGNVQHEGGFTHGRAGGDNDEITFLESAGEGVQGGKAAGQAGNGLFISKFPCNFLEFILHGLADGGEIGTPFIAGHFQNGLFRVVRNVRHILPLGVGFVGNGAGGVDEPAELGLACHDFRMAVHGLGGHHVGGKLIHIKHAAYVVQPAHAL